MESAKETKPCPPYSLIRSRLMVVKVGSRLVAPADGTAPRLTALATDIAAARQRGTSVVVVSSGALALGLAELARLPAAPPGGRRLRIAEARAATALGQAHLIRLWREAFAAHDIAAAQVLLTPEDTENRNRHLNARATLSSLLSFGVVPILNENDTVATDELRFGDNDRLAARAAAMLGADALVLFSDVEGLYASDPRSNPAAAFVPEVSSITPEVEAFAGALRPSETSRGGMRSKLEAARLACASGAVVFLADGRAPNPLARLATEGAVAGDSVASDSVADDSVAGDPPVRRTRFLPSAAPGAARKRWIAGTLSPSGRLFVDAGAEAALLRGTSLLPAGVARVEGSFERGDSVAICRDSDGREFARGLAAYGSADAVRIAGMQSDRLGEVLGWRGRDELVHRDDLAML